MCQKHNGTRIYTKVDCGNWSKEQALKGASRDALRAGLERPRSLPGSRCNATLQVEYLLNKGWLFNIVVLIVEDVSDDEIVS